MLGRKLRIPPARQGTACRRAVETLELRQLLSAGPFGATGGFATREYSAPFAPSAMPGDLHASLHNGDADGREHGSAFGPSSRDDFGGHRADQAFRRFARSGENVFNRNEWRDERLTSDRDLPGWGEAPVSPGRGRASDARYAYFATDGVAPSYGGEAIVFATTWGTAGNPVIAPTPVKIAIPPAVPIFVALVPIKTLPGDFGHAGGSAAHGAAERQPAFQHGKAPDAPQPAAEYRDPALPGMERGQQRQARPAIAPRDVKPAMQNGPAVAPTDSRADQARPAGRGEAGPARPAGAVASTEAAHARGMAAAVAGAAGHVVDVSPAARAAGSLAAAVQRTAAVTVDHAGAAVWQSVVGRIEAAAAKVVEIVEGVAWVDGAFDAVAVSADVSDVGPGLLYLPTGPTMFLGLAPVTVASARASSWWPSHQTWRITEAVSLVIAVAGYGYCRADAARRRQVRPVSVRSGIVSIRRPSEGL